MVLSIKKGQLVRGWPSCRSLRALYLGCVNNAGPREEFVKRRRDLFVGHGIGVGEKDRRVRLSRFVGEDPIEIAVAVRSKAEAFPPALRGQIENILLAFKIERKKGFDPFRWILRLRRVLGVRPWPADFDLFGEDGFVIVVKGDETPR